MEIKYKRNITLIEKEQLMNSLNIMFNKNPSPYGYKHDIEELLKDLEITENEFFSLVLESFSKVKRNNEDLIFIASYLFFMQEFIKLLKAKESYKKEKKLLNYLMHLSSEIFYDQMQKDMILMRYGDKGDKAYINLIGNVDVLVPNSKLMSVNENDYLLYLASLIKYKEYDLINFVLNDNFPNYPLIIYDDLSANIEQIPSILENIKKSKKKFSTFIKIKDKEINKTILDVDNIIINLKLKIEKNRKSSPKVDINLNNKETLKTIQSEDQNQNNTYQKAFRLNQANEELAMSLELYIISLNQLLDLFDFSGYNNDNDDEIINCSSEEYIKRLNVPNPEGNTDSNALKNTSNNPFYELTIHYYTKIISLGKGNFFGELALRDPKAVRTATIITSTDCHFAYLNRKTYNNSLKTNTELHLKNQLTFFINLPIFADIPAILFYKKYYTHISKHYLAKNKFVIKQGEKPTELCLLYKGNYELVCNMNLKELTDSIFYFIEKIKKFHINFDQKELNYYNDMLNLLKESNKREAKLLKKYSKFQNLYVKETLMKISEMSCPDITGFEEIIGKNGLYAFSLQAKTIENIIYSLEFNFYKDLYQRNPLVQKRHDYIIKIKLDLIIKRLLKIRNRAISSLFNHQTEDDIGFLVSKEIENLYNQQKIGKRFLNLKNTKLNFGHKHNISFDIKGNNNNEQNLFMKKITQHKHTRNISKKERINIYNKMHIKIIKNNKTYDEKISNTSNSKNKKNKENKNKKDILNQTTPKYFFTENYTFNNMNLVPVIELRNYYNSKPIKINKKEEIFISENNKLNNLLKGKKVDKSIKCYFDKKVKVTDSINFSEKIREKKRKLKLKDIKLNSIILNKKKDFQNYTFYSSEDKKTREHNNNEKSSKYYFGRLPSPNIINLNMQVLTTNKMNLTSRDPFFQKKIQKLINVPKTSENKKEKIEEILKDNDNSINNKPRISVFKRDDYYKKNLTRIKFFYGFDKK